MILCLIFFLQNKKSNSFRESRPRRLYTDQDPIILGENYICDTCDAVCWKFQKFEEKRKNERERANK